MSVKMKGNKRIEQYIGNQRQITSMLSSKS